MDMTDVVLFVHQFATLSMVGVIWFVQVVHYPLFECVAAADFSAFEQRHQRRTTVVVMPLMIAEAVSALLLFRFRPDSVPLVAVQFGAVLVLVIWASTFFLQVPAHNRLSLGFDARVHQRLVRTNWIRTASWTARGVLVCWMSRW
jgi:hypothetical protein